MNKMFVALVGVLACIASVTSQQELPPQGPWQSLNPPVSPSVEASAKPHRDEVALTDEEEFLVSNIPFKLPFKMDKKQTAVAMKLLKEAVKPVIKSKTLQGVVAQFDEILSDFVHDRDMQMYTTLFFDFMQEVYEGKQSARVDKIVRGFIQDNSDEVTGRTIGDVWNYFAEPVDRYIFSTMRSYVVRPISNAVSTFAERIGTLMGNDIVRPYDPYGESYNSHTSWSKTVNNYARQLSHLSRQARQSLAFAADVIEAQDHGVRLPAQTS